MAFSKNNWHSTHFLTDTIGDEGSIKQSFTQVALLLGM